MQFNLINKFEFSHATGEMCVRGGYRVIESGKKTTLREMNYKTTIKDFLAFCQVCIASEQGENEAVNLAAYGITYKRASFRNRFFTRGELQLFVGEVYVMYEVLKHKFNTDRFKMYKVYNQYLFINRTGNVIISDKDMLHVGVFRYEMFQLVKFNALGKPQKDECGYNQKLSIGNIQNIEMVSGACHPYVYLRYRDMVISVSLSDWEKIKYLCYAHRYEYEEI